MTSISRNLNPALGHRIVVTSLSQVPPEHRDQCRKMVEDARDGYVNGSKVKGKADLRIKILFHPERGLELLHGSESAIKYQGITGFIAPVRFSL